MAEDIVRELGYLFLGSRMKRLAERMQGEVARVVERAGLPIQPSQYPLLAALDRYGPMTVTQAMERTGVSQPAVTRILSRLVELELVETSAGRDQRHKVMALTKAGRDAMARSKREIWAPIDRAVTELCEALDGDLLDRLTGLEAALADAPLDERAARGRGLLVREFSDELAPAFHAINAEWISAMFRLEATDRDVLENPRARIVDPGGVILFAELDGEIVGACALQKTGESQFELTKMGVLERARGKKVGEFLLHAMLRRARQMGIERLYLLTSAKCASATHLYEKAGFVHDADVMRDFGARYARCDVAMLYAPERAGQRLAA